MIKMSREAASDELELILDEFEIKIDDEVKDLVIRALMAGRLSWDSGDQSFTVQLRNPIELDNGSKIDILIVQEPTAGQIKKANTVHDPLEASLRLLGYCTDQPSGYIERLRQRDLNLLGALTGFFR